MNSKRGKIFYGWIVLGSCAFVVFGVAGTQFSFGVFLKPMLEEFGWTRASLATAFGVTFLLAGLLRPLAGYLADHYSPKLVALSGVVLMAVMLLVLPYVNNLRQLYYIFAVMSIGITLAAGTTLAKVVTSWFHQQRGVAFGVLTGGGSAGGLILVPAASAVLVLASWQAAYQFLALLLFVVVVPLGLFLIRNRPEDMGLRALGEPGDVPGSGEGISDRSTGVAVPDATIREAIGSPFFWKLTFGYFV